MSSTNVCMIELAKAGDVSSVATTQVAHIVKDVARIIIVKQRNKIARRATVIQLVPRVCNATGTEGVTARPG